MNDQDLGDAVKNIAREVVGEELDTQKATDLIKEKVHGLIQSDCSVDMSDTEFNIVLTNPQTGNVLTINSPIHR